MSNNSSDNSDDSRSENSDNSDNESQSNESENQVVRFSEDKLVPANQIEINLNNNLFENSLNKKSRVHGVSFGTGFKSKGSNAFQKTTLNCVKTINNDLDRLFEDLNTKISKKNDNLRETNNNNINKFSEISKIKTENNLYTGPGNYNYDFFGNKFYKTNIQPNNQSQNMNNLQMQNIPSNNIPIKQKEEFRITKTENFDINQVVTKQKNENYGNIKNAEKDNKKNRMNEEKINFENINKIINKNNEFKYNSSFKYKDESDHGNVKYLRSVTDLYKGSTGIKPTVPISYDKKKNEYRPLYKNQTETSNDNDVFSKTNNFQDYEKKIFDNKNLKNNNIELDLDKVNSKVDYQKYKEYMNQIKPKNIDQAINILLNN